MPRALWITPALAAFVQANEGTSWERIYNKWCTEHPDQPAPGNHEQMRRHFRKGEKKYLQKPLAVKVPTTMIPCLTCDAPFPSEGIFNRRCQPCKDKD
jgi:hypothetical protein